MTMRRFTSDEVAQLGKSTLKHHGIEWAYFSLNGHLALGYHKHAIHFNPQDRMYHLKESGQTIFSDPDMAKCLDQAPNYIFEYHSNQQKVSWES